MFINIIEGILLSLFITSLVQIPKKKLLCQLLTALTSFSIIQISNFISMYDIFLTSIVIITVTMVVKYFSTDSLSKILFAACLECVLYSYAGFISLLLLDYLSFITIEILAKIIYILLMIPLIFTIKGKKLYFSNQLYYILSAILFCMQFEFTFLIQIYFSLGYQIKEIRLFSFVTLIGQAVFLYIIFYISYLYLIKLDYERLEMEKENYDTLVPLYEEIKIMKHDLKHDYNTYIHFINENKIDKLLYYINKNREELNENMELIHTPDNLLNIIINNKIINAYKNHIQVYTYIKISKEINIDKYDLSTLLSNMLDNAIENSSNDIMIKIVEDGPYLHISIKNSFEGTFTTNTKKNKKYHGFGLKSIENICKKYYSNLNISINYDCVTMETSLYLK